MAECNSLEAFPDGLIVGNRSVGSIVTYQCNPGLVLDGDSTRRCQSNQTWTGVVPRCLGNPLFDVNRFYMRFNVRTDYLKSVTQFLESLFENFRQIKIPHFSSMLSKELFVW